MTPKKKAKELIKRFTPFCRIYPEIIDNQFILSNDVKICAVITVNEILEELENIDDGQTVIPYDYWNKVKQEIENL